MTSRWENGMMWVISLGRVRVTSLIFVGPWDSINFTWWGLISRTELTVMRPDGAPSRLDLFVYGSFLHVQLHYSASPETRHHFVETRIQIMFNSIRCVYNYKRKTSRAEKRLGEKWPVTVRCHWMYTFRWSNQMRELPRKFTSLAVTPGIDSKDMSLCFYVRDFYDERFVYPSWHHAVRVPMPAVSSDSALNYPDNCQSIVDSNTNWIKYRKCKYWIIQPKHPKSNTSRIPGIDC